MYDIGQKSIWFSNGTHHQFPGEVAEIVEFEDVIVIRLDCQPPMTHRNVYALDRRGNMLWQIPEPISYAVQAPYVAIYRHGGFVDAVNWDGRILQLHPQLGRILRESVIFDGPPSSRRTSSARQWV